MKNKNIKIAIAGDICVNLLQWKTTHTDARNFGWKSHPQVHRSFKYGEALLLSKLVEISTGASILAPVIDNIKDCVNDTLLLSSVELGFFPEISGFENNNKKSYRVNQFFGFTGPNKGLPKMLPIKNDDENVDMVILDDENNGFSLSEEFWPSAIKNKEKSPLVIYKTNHLNSSNPLWKQIEENHLDNTVVVINGDDLRSKGVNISRGLSWEKAALDFVWQMNNNPALDFLSKSRHLIVPLGLEGAIIYRNDGVTKRSQLFFLTTEFEGEFIKNNKGQMFGLTSCFVAGLARALVNGIHDKDRFERLEDGIREGMVASLKYFVNGFGEEPDKEEFPNPFIFREREQDFIYKEHIQDVQIRNSFNPNCQSCWYIIKDKSSTNLEGIAYDIVKNGEKSALRFIPIARFGNLKAVDRTEIESYRSIKNLMNEYIATPKVSRPLSIAVFGTPGSGKSFGVTEVASTIAPELIVKLDFNLSQFQSILDLTAAFHRVRDVSLQGNLPLVFFDEFDSDFNGKLGWLKYFLAPMQDGVFREGDSIHPIGKAIFVFAGGTSSTFKDFRGETIEETIEYEQFFKEFQSKKGPDFISRLRGYVNILGPNQTDEKWDPLFVIRRAMLLRSFIERKTPHLLNENGEAQIDNGVVRAMLKVARYKHESRSMEAIMEMSSLSFAKTWEQSHLPSKDQLKLHVDEEEFLQHLMRDTFYNEKIERLAANFHNSHIEAYKNMKNINESYRTTYWELLDEEYKDSIRLIIRYIPNALQKINYDIISVKEKPEVIEFTDQELIMLAEYEHKRWCLDKKEKGWVYGEVIDAEKKTHNALMPYYNLPDEIKESFLKDIKSWPQILANSYLKIERLKYLCYCETHGFETGKNPNLY